MCGGAPLWAPAPCFVSARLLVKRFYISLLFIYFKWHQRKTSHWSILLLSLLRLASGSVGHQAHALLYQLRVDCDKDLPHIDSTYIDKPDYHLNYAFETAVSKLQRAVRMNPLMQRKRLWNYFELTIILLLLPPPVTMVMLQGF